MESTGIYWKPIWRILQGSFDLVLANPYKIKNIPGQKTDKKDASWIAKLLVTSKIMCKWKIHSINQVKTLILMYLEFPSILYALSLKTFGYIH